MYGVGFIRDLPEAGIHSFGEPRRIIDCITERVQQGVEICEILGIEGRSPVAHLRRIDYVANANRLSSSLVTQTRRHDAAVTFSAPRGSIL